MGAPTKPVRTVGFTGTREGMTKPQQHRVAGILCWIGVTHFMHGDCVGADEQSHDLARMVGARIRVHPPIESGLRAHCRADVTAPARPYLDRNRDIVDNCRVLIAAPAGPETLRSGTWATVRYARRIGKPVIVVMPDGSTEGDASGAPAPGAQA